jgi:hypothetical protein
MTDNSEDDQLVTLLARIRTDLLRAGLSDRPRVIIDTSTGRRRRTGKVSGPPMISPNRKVPVSPMEPPKKRGRRKKNELPEHLRTVQEKVLHEWDFTGFGQIVNVRADTSIDRRLARWKIRRGPHIDMFYTDFERVNSSLRSPDLNGGAGGGGFGATTMSESTLMAAESLHNLRVFLGEDNYALVIVALILRAGPAELHLEGAEQHVVVTCQIRDAVNLMESFYFPERTRHSRTGAAAIRLIQKAKRGVISS